jgi:hypothetical protein
VKINFEKSKLNLIKSDQIILINSLANGIKEPPSREKFRVLQIKLD